MVMRIAHDGHRGYLGVQLVEMTPDLRTHFGAPADAGVFIGKVEKDSPAAKAGSSRRHRDGRQRDARRLDPRRLARPCGEESRRDGPARRVPGQRGRHVTVTVGELPERKST